MVASYRLYGVTLESDFPFAAPLTPGTGAADLSFSCGQDEPAAGDWRGGPPVFSSPNLDDAGESAARLHRGRGFEVLGFGRWLDFYLWPDRIYCRLLDPAAADLVELRLLGPVMAYWLERRGVTALHASAVAAEGRSVAFLSGKRGGKTSLACALVARGNSLVTDDILPVDGGGAVIAIRSGIPEVRLWPDATRRLLGGDGGLERLHSAVDKLRVPLGRSGLGSFEGEPPPLAAIYLPNRRSPGEGAEETRIAPVASSEAVIALVRNSFSPYIVEALGLQPARLDLFARLVDRVAVRGLDYPSGFDRLEEVAAAVLADLSAL